MENLKEFKQFSSPLKKTKKFLKKMTASKKNFNSDAVVSKKFGLFLKCPSGAWFRPPKSHSPFANIGRNFFSKC